MQIQESKLKDVPEPIQVKRTCESCGSADQVLCWRFKTGMNECWYPPGTVKVVDEEPNGRRTTVI